MTSLATRTERGIEWNAIHDAILSATNDPKRAVAMADEVQTALDFYHDDARKQKRRARVAALLAVGKRVWRVLAKVLATGIVLAAAALAAFGIYLWIGHFGKHDYAGYGPSKVTKHTQAALNTYFGENDRPAFFTYWRKSQSNYSGLPAWRAVYTTPKGRVLCVYVWKGALDGTNPHQVRWGKDC
jgi:hypothetical protein